MVELKITKLEEGQKLKKLCFKYFDKAPQSFTYKMLRKKNIVLNDKKASGDETLSINDTVRFYLSDDTINLFHTSHDSKHTLISDENSNAFQFRLDANNIIFENDDYLIIDKPAGVLSQKATVSDYSVNEAVIDYMIDNNMISSEQLDNFRPSVCNRLDRNTSGLITAGKTLKGLRYLSDRMSDKSGNDVTKIYYTVVHGRFNKDGIISLGFTKSVKDNTVSVDENCKGSNIIKTGFRLLEYNEKQNISLVEAVLYTGKSHQIRVSLKHLGYPVVGDRKYGSPDSDRKIKPRPKRQLLHAGMLKLSDNEIFNAHFPKDFEDYFRYGNMEFPRTQRVDL